MGKYYDLTGKTFGNWLVLYRNGSTANKASVWRCKCTLCGSEKDVVGQSLRNGVSSKCRACVPRTALSKPMRNTRLYHIYTAMKQRCTNPHTKHFDIYGGRGISVCKSWSDSFDVFAEWALSNGYSEDLSIERIDTNGDYCPSNCRWIPLSEQAENRRCCHYVIYQGAKYTVSKACRLANINRNKVRWYKKSHDSATWQESFNSILNQN